MKRVCVIQAQFTSIHPPLFPGALGGSPLTDEDTEVQRGQSWPEATCLEGGAAGVCPWVVARDPLWVGGAEKPWWRCAGVRGCLVWVGGWVGPVGVLRV